MYSVVTYRMKVFYREKTKQQIQLIILRQNHQEQWGNSQDNLQLWKDLSLYEHHQI